LGQWRRIGISRRNLPRQGNVDRRPEGAVSVSRQQAQAGRARRDEIGDAIAGEVARGHGAGAAAGARILDAAKRAVGIAEPNADGAVAGICDDQIGLTADIDSGQSQSIGRGARVVLRQKIESHETAVFQPFQKEPASLLAAGGSVLRASVGRQLGLRGQRIEPGAKPHGKSPQGMWSALRWRRPPDAQQCDGCLG